MQGANNQLLEDADHTYQYDTAGNRVRRTEKATGDYQTYAWDHRNRLVAVSFHDASDTLTRPDERGGSILLLEVSHRTCQVLLNARGQ